VGRSVRGRVVLFVTLAALLVGGSALGYLTLVAPRLWQSYTDPTSGFSFRYPPGWLLTTDSDGSHPTVVNPHDRATISVYSDILSGSPDSLLGEAAPAGSIDIQHRTVAGNSALDFVIPGAEGGGTADVDPGQLLRLHLVVVAAAATSSTTNEFILALSEPPNGAGSSDNANFEQLVGSFAPTASGSPLPFLGRSGAPRALTIPSSTGCKVICWADLNWNINDYTADSSGQECAAYDDIAGDYVNCAAGLVATLGEFQPAYQCSEFVSRALALEGLLPGMAAGGPGGTSSQNTDEFGNYSYNVYPFTSSAEAGNGDTVYNLLGVGTPGTPGLYDYLVNSGIGVSVHQNLAAAEPGDVVFFYTSEVASENREHVMLITSLLHYSSTKEGMRGWDALLDGHNRSAYHSLLSTLQSSSYPFEIIHLAAHRGSSYAFSTTGSGWGTGSDNNSEPLVFTATTSAASPSAQATVNLPSTSRSCELVAYIPNINATASARFQITFASGKVAQSISIDESAVDGWVLLMLWSPPGTGSPPHRVVVGNDTGADGDSLGLGPLWTFCAG
jgi:hypothetical protein